ncbi:hypothetical protein RKD39_006005 [Streptomyces albogriseolus]
MLDRAGDAVGDVQLRGDRLAGLADLVGVRVPAGVDGGTRGADGRAERVGERLDDREVLRAVDTAAAGDDDRAASVSSGRPVDSRGVRPVTLVPVACSEKVTLRDSTAPAAGAASTAAEFGLTVMTGVPLETRDLVV